MMDKTKVPAVPALTRVSNLHSEIAVSAAERWNPGITALAKGDDEGTVDIFGIIGEDWLTGASNTVKRISAALRSIGDKPVVVNINSPGGDFFEGLAIYNLLREHPQRVTVRVLGLAASSASIIAMAGDVVMVPRAGFLMLHNTQWISIGDRHDFAEAAAFLKPFDEVLAQVYAARTGKDVGEVTKMLDRETWLGGADAVDAGFADELLPADQVKLIDMDAQARQIPAAHRIDAVLARAGISRTERRTLIKDVKGSTPSAADPEGTQNAAVMTAFNDTLDKLRTISGATVNEPSQVAPA